MSMKVYGTLGPMLARINDMQQRLDKVMKEAAFRLERIMVLHIQDQDLDHEPLSFRYIFRKIAEGYSEDILIRTGTALETVRVIQIDKDSYFVGWPRGIKDKDGKEEVFNIMAVHEFGSNDGTIPARPIVQPSLKELEEWLRPKLEQEIRTALA